MLNHKHLYYFYLTATAASFARASEQANVTQPALSNAIKSLENQLGFSLFDRTARPVRLTPHGWSFKIEVEKLLFQAQNVENSSRYLRLDEKGHVRLGMTPVFAASFGGEAAAVWLHRNRKMTLDVTVRPTPILLDKIMAEDLDIVVGITSELHPGAGKLNLVELNGQAGHLFCRVGHPILGNPNIAPSDLQQYKLVAAHYAPLVLAQAARTLGFETSEDLPIVVNSENTDLLCDLTANSDFLMLNTYECVRHAIALSRIEVIDLKLETLAQWSVATRSGRLLHPLTGDLIDVIRSFA